MEAATSGSRSGLLRVEHIMGMPIIIDVRDHDVGPEALEAAFDWFRIVDARFSTYKADSEICRLNRGDLALEDAHPDVREVLARCEALREDTYGYFDIRAPGLLPGASAVDGSAPASVDPSGLVKGWSIVRAAEILAAAGARNFMINAGGDIVTRGCPFPELYWRIGIQHPSDRQSLAAVVALSDRAIATSGAYERGQHIVDPHTGRPPEGILSVTIIGDDLATVDAYATAAFAMGAAGPAWTARLAGHEAMTIKADGTVLSTMGFPSL